MKNKEEKKYEGEGGAIATLLIIFLVTGFALGLSVGIVGTFLLIKGN